MTDINAPERKTQNRIVKLFREELGYTYYGWWKEREGNANIEEEKLRHYLLHTAGYPEELVKRAIYRLQSEARSNDRDLYYTNKAVYELLRYGAEAAANPGDRFERLHFINWNDPEVNEFAIAEEVTILGNREKRPDIVLYINGIAIGVLELKRSSVNIGEGIRQNITNQQEAFIRPFFATVQLVLAGNDSEGLRYGTTATEEKYFMQWREDEEDNSRLKLDKYLLKLCNKKRLLELLHDFVLFDGGKKKLPRYHQYFGIKAAQESVRRREGGVIWHTQGSGKSLTMVLLAKWILASNPRARVAVITDRDELDKQIEQVFKDAGEKVYRTSSGKDLISQLGQPSPRLLCSLIHKFGRKDVDDFDRYIEELNKAPSKVFGEIFVFVDECHRTQSKKLHRAMKATLQNAVFIGFTGTPLLKADVKTTRETFGRFIHTYKFDQGVEDKVILDLMYEARDIDQQLTSKDRVDAWFEAKTKGLNDFQKSELKKKWGTMQKVLSSKSRITKVVNDVVFDFSTKPRLSDGKGNAILVAGSILETCKYYEVFQQTEFKGRCAVVTSYNPSAKDINTEDTGANTETEKEFIYRMYSDLLKDVKPAPGKSKTETFEDQAKQQFIKEPSLMRLLIVVDKLLTGFDAPACTYLYIDKSMQDHGLFQAICRVNRLDSEDKEFGYIVDYKDLFKKVENAVAVYTSELDDEGEEQHGNNILLQKRLEKSRERLEQAIEALELICSPVEPPKSTLEYQHYFCGNTEIEGDLKATEIRRFTLYKAIVSLIRAYAHIADEMDEAGYSKAEQDGIKKKMDFYLELRQIIRLASDEILDMKPYEADMRHLIDFYIQANDPRNITPFGDMSLLDIIVRSGIADAVSKLPPGIQNNRESVAETIENNVRQKLIREHMIDPAFFEEMSTLLDQIIAERRSKAIDYEAYLKKIADLATHVQNGRKGDLPASIKTAGLRALYSNLDKNEELALKVHHSVLDVRQDGWRDNDPKENIIKAALFKIFGNEAEVERIFILIKGHKEY